MESVDLIEILYSLKKRWTLILMVTLVITLLVGVYSFFIASPMYESTVSIYVFKQISADQSGTTYNEIMLNNQLAKNYRVLILSRNVLSEVQENLNIGEDITYEQLKSNISVSLEQDTSYLNIKVKNINPQNAANIANEIANVFGYKVKEIMNIDNVTVIDQAQPQINPISPNKKVNMALGVVIGLVLSVGLAIAIDFFDTRIKYPEDIKRRYDLPIIGAIPVITEEEADNIFINSQNTYIVSTEASFFESYRNIRTNIMFSNVDNPYKTLLITSSIPGEGKTSVACNVALSFAKAGMRTIIVDVDLRRPRIHRAFNIKTVKGLTSVLVADVDYDRVIKHNVFENLDVLPAGIRPPNPAELLGSAAMKSLIKSLEEEYDVVILDSPPVSVFTDAASLATDVDAVLYVVSSGVVHQNELNRGLENLKNVNANVIGVVMTRIETDAKGQDYYSYKYTYNYNYRGRNE